MELKPGKMIRMAVVGAGYMGQNHVRVLSSLPNVNLIAVCDTDNNKTETIAKQYKIKSYKNYKDLLNGEELDAISICLPTTLHFEAAMYALGKKVAVMLEKPICAKVEQARRVINLSNKLNVPIMVGHIERFNPVVNEIKRRIRTGELGRVLQVHTQRFSPPPGRAKDVSAIIDLATHDLDIINYLLDDVPVRLYAEKENKFHKKDDLMSALIRFRSGTIGLVEVSWLHPIKKRNLTIIGQNGMYVANYITQELFFYPQDGDLFKRANGEKHVATNADVIKIAFDSKEPLQVELKSFVDCLLSKSSMPVTAIQALNAIVLAEKIINSGERNKVLK